MVLDVSCSHRGCNMASEESFGVLVHHRGSIKRKTRSGVKFTDKDPLCIVVKPTTSYDDLVRSVLMKLGLEGAKRVKKFFYRIPITVLQDTVKYDCFTIGSDEDLQVMFLCRRQFPEVRTPELLAKLVDVVSSSGGSNRNATTEAAAAGSSSNAECGVPPKANWSPTGVVAGSFRSTSKGACVPGV
ncbi:Putative mutator sub-class protein [Arachis hypogaea]|uniref:Mutator sub-class protein n=1 Tax=Arachis hypogaea TaxID=3818 RepID=A0A6B9V4G9_ARAHY|nr:Putative mutator sub-class protein [Arachis hypogaea]